MTIQYTVLGFEPTTFGTRVSSHNHQTRAPTQLPTYSYLIPIELQPIMFGWFLFSGYERRVFPSGCEFESQRCVTDGSFSHFLKNVLMFEQTEESPIMTMFNTARVWIQLHIYQANLVNFMTTQKLLKVGKVTFE